MNIKTLSCSSLLALILATSAHPFTLDFSYNGIPIAGVEVIQTESDGTETIFASDIYGQVYIDVTDRSAASTLEASFKDASSKPISVQDALYILQNLVELRTLTEDQIKAADINADGKITIQDALKVLQHNVELITINQNLVFYDAMTGSLLSESQYVPDNTPIIRVIRLGDVNQSFNPESITNHAPILTGKTTLSIEENQTSIGTITASDADGDSLTYALSGSDASNFSLSSDGVLTFNSAPDYEVDQISYSLSIIVSDGQNEFTRTITVNVTDVAEDSSDPNYFLIDPVDDTEHIDGIYNAKHCFFTKEVNEEEETRWLWDAGLTDEQKVADYSESQSVTLTNGETVLAECNNDYSMGFGTNISTATSENANNLGIYGISQYLRIWDELDTRPPPQAGVWGQWIQPHAMHPYFTLQSIEGGLFSDDKVGRSKYPKYMASGQSHLYSGDSTQFGWGFYEKRVSCEYLGGIQIANKLLYPPNLLAFDEDQEEHVDDGGLFFGHGWIAMPMIGGKTRENWTTGGTDDVRDVNSGKLTWTFFVDAKNFSGPLHAYVPEFWYRRLNKFNALEILNEYWEEGESTDTEFLNKVKDYFADKISEAEFESLVKEQSWYADGVEDFDEDVGGSYIVRAKDSLAFNPVPGVAIGAERDPSIGLTYEDESGTMYLKTFLPKIPDKNNIEPFFLSGRTYGVEHYNNFIEFFNSEDIPTVNFETTSYTTAFDPSKIDGEPGPDTIAFDEEEEEDNWWKKTEIKDANGNPIPNKHSFNMSVDTMFETADRGSNVYWDWKNETDRMFNEYYKVTPSDNPEDYIFERVSEDVVPEKLKSYRYGNIERATSYMPHVKTSDDESLIASIKSDMKEIFDADLDYMDYSCRVCDESNGCDSTVYTAELDDGSKVDYRWYKFKDQPTFIQLKKEFPDIYTDEYLESLQEKIEHIHANWQDSKDFLSRPSSAQTYNVNLVEIDNELILEPPAGKEIGWVPVAISVEMPGKKWQTEVNWWDGPQSRENWDGTGSEAYRIRSW